MCERLGQVDEGTAATLMAPRLFHTAQSGDGLLLQRFQARPCFLLAKRSQAKERSPLRFSWKRLVSFPVVDRLGRRARKQTELCCRETEALPHGPQAFRREAQLAGR